jgi:hypothetical protein
VEQAEQGAGFIGEAYVGLGTDDSIHLFLVHMQESKSLAAEGLNPNRTALRFHNPKLEVGLGLIVWLSAGDGDVGVTRYLEKTSMGRELAPAIEEGRSRERSGAAPGPLRAHVLGLVEEDEEAEATARAAQEGACGGGCARAVSVRASPCGMGWVGERVFA